jgi:pimeloyl-ACP methyl ester carboxylesterase
MQVIVDGLLTNYYKVGHGPVVLGLHGWGDNSRTFSQLSKNLEERYEFIGLDLPGFGESQTICYCCSF